MQNNGIYLVFDYLFNHDGLPSALEYLPKGMDWTPPQGRNTQRWRTNTQRQCTNTMCRAQTRHPEHCICTEPLSVCAPPLRIPAPPLRVLVLRKHPIRALGMLFSSSWQHVFSKGIVKKKNKKK